MRIDAVTLGYTTTGSTKVKIYYGESVVLRNVLTVPASTSESSYTTDLENLKDDTKYFYKVNSIDSDGAEYEGTSQSFTTLPRPKISQVRVRQIAETAQPTVLVSWKSNTAISSIVTYYSTLNLSEAKDEVKVELTAGDHQMILRGLRPKTEYTLIVSGRDKAGNEARSERQTFTIATDTRPPRITSLKVEGSTTKVKGGQTPTKLAQLVVSWTTDEPATSQVEFGEGIGTDYSQKNTGR